MNRLESAVLARPAKPVSEIDGKNAARAAPMFALADWRACSAARMSGRRWSSSDGRPTGIAVRIAVASSGGGGGRPSGSGCPDEQVEGVRGLRALPPGVRDGRARRGELGERGARVEIGALAGLDEAPRHLAALPDRRQRLLGERELLVGGALGQVLHRDLGDEREVRAAPGLLGREVVLERGRLEAAHARRTDRARTR